MHGGERAPPISTLSSPLGWVPLVSLCVTKCETTAQAVVHSNYPSPVSTSCVYAPANRRCGCRQSRKPLYVKSVTILVKSSRSSHACQQPDGPLDLESGSNAERRRADRCCGIGDGGSDANPTRLQAGIKGSPSPAAPLARGAKMRDDSAVTTDRIWGFRAGFA
jgi:hypothetical protein